VCQQLRGSFEQLPFETYSHRLIVAIVYKIMFWLNCFPHKDSIHDVMSLRTILTSLTIHHNKQCKLEFGTYVQIHEEHDNSPMTHTAGSISLPRTGNTRGPHYFLNINSGSQTKAEY